MKISKMNSVWTSSFNFKCLLHLKTNTSFFGLNGERNGKIIWILTRFGRAKRNERFCRYIQNRIAHDPKGACANALIFFLWLDFCCCCHLFSFEGKIDRTKDKYAYKWTNTPANEIETMHHCPKNKFTA